MWWSNEIAAPFCPVIFAMKTWFCPFRSSIGADRKRRALGKFWISSNARELHARKMTTLGQKINGQMESDTRLSLDERSRVRARRGPRPARSRLEARPPVCGSLTEVNLVGRGALQGRVRSVGSVPANEQRKLVAKRAAQQRHDSKQSGALLFQGFNRSLNDRDAPLLADGAETLADAKAPAPVFVGCRTACPCR